MEMKIYANETESVLFALTAGLEKIDSLSYQIKNYGKDFYLYDDFIKDLASRKETLDRVISRIKEL